MVIQGNYRIESSVQNVWDHLMDPKVLERITPGISELVDLGDDTYKAVSKIKIGPVQGKFEGRLEIKDKVKTSTATLVVDQKSKIGNVVAEILVQLNEIDRVTEIDYKGEARLSGKIAMMGQRIVGGVITSLSRQFFVALNNEINS